jgi:hypothetical protein
MSGGERPSSGSDRSKREAEPENWRRARADEIRAELEDHVARRARSLESSGLSPGEAHAEAKRRLGDASRIEEDLMRIAERRRRRVTLVRWLDDGARDVKLAVRSFVRRPVLALGVVLTVGLAAGAFASVFSMVNGVLLRPLSFPQADHLYSVYTRYLPECVHEVPAGNGLRLSVLLGIGAGVRRLRCDDTCNVGRGAVLHGAGEPDAGAW